MPIYLPLLPPLLCDAQAKALTPLPAGFSDQVQLAEDTGGEWQVGGRGVGCLLFLSESVSSNR